MKKLLLLIIPILALFSFTAYASPDQSVITAFEAYHSAESTPVLASVITTRQRKENLNMIKPTNGRIVHYIPDLKYDNELGLVINDSIQPMSAQVAYVYGDRLVNLVITDHGGNLHPRTSVGLVQDGDDKPEGGGYCQWMDYQKGQAAKTESLEKQLEPERQTG